MSLPDECLDMVTPWNHHLSAKYKRSFAYHTVQSRLPVILTQVIDHLSREREMMYEIYGEECKEELKEVIGSLSKLKNEIQTNKPLLALHSDEPDIKQWNAFLQTQEENCGRALSWFSSVWLHVECYMYRRIREAFALTLHLQTHDPFKHLKEAAFAGSVGAMITVGAFFLRLEVEPSANVIHTKNHLLQFLKLSLWGNRCDLSLSNGKDVIQADNPFELFVQLDSLILINDFELVWQIISKASGTRRVIDIVLDNAGYELFTDLCLADYLVRCKLADCIQFHGKMIPWFISDTMESDFRWTLEFFAKHNNRTLLTLGKRWLSFIDSGAWNFTAEPFWTLPYSFDAMETVDPELYCRLTHSTLIIFKGDLNYRKLMGDINWPHTEQFINGLQGFHPCPILSLRTIKADVVTGLTEGQAEEVAQVDPDWQSTGKYATISCVD